MAVSSMTGFARAAGESGRWRWTFELKSVNAKGLDLRLRMPAPFDRVETEARARLAKALARGTCFGTLIAQREGSAIEARIDEAALRSIAAAAREAAAKAGLAAPTMDGLLALRGVVETVEAADDEASIAAACAGALESIDEAAAALGEARRAEGEALAALLGDRLKAIAALAEAADMNPARRPEAVRERLRESVEALMGSTRGLDENRLYQEAILLAAKADIREELDRLKTHVKAALALIQEGHSPSKDRRSSERPHSPSKDRRSSERPHSTSKDRRSSERPMAIGRRLDFLAQELAREASTLSAKANDVSLTAQGLELRAQIEQFREQVQNVE